MSATLEPLVPLTPEEAHARVVAHFSEPGAVFGRFNHTCVYRGDDDPLSPIRCGAGALIPNDLYGSWMEGTTIGGVLGDPRSEDLKVLFSNIDELLRCLQSCHDFAAESYLPSKTVQDFVELISEWDPNDRTTWVGFGGDNLTLHHD